MKDVKAGDIILFRGKYATELSIPGKVELVEGDQIGIRLINGNFYLAEKDQIKPSNYEPEYGSWAWKRE